jgi:CheY-like chemotaxis protein
VRIYSELDHGTTVRLYLPRLAEPGGVHPLQPVSTEEAPSGTETILVVEDDDFVRATVERQLERLGYNVLSAPDGPSGLAVLRGGAPVGLLFTDVVMPGGMNGVELAEQARRLRPGLPVLFTSGYTETAIGHQGRLGPGAHLLNKPYRQQELAIRVRKALEDGDASRP